jgi:hypothetical protein
LSVVVSALNRSFERIGGSFILARPRQFERSIRIGLPECAAAQQEAREQCQDKDSGVSVHGFFFS